MRSPDPALTVHKFGGAALADAAAIRRVTSIVAQDTAPQKLVVASAMLGVTDELLGVAHEAASSETVGGALDALRERHLAVLHSIGLDGRSNIPLQARLDEAFDELRHLCVEIAKGGELTPAMTDAFVAHGDRIAARLVAAALTANGTMAEFVEATDVVRADGPHGNASPDIEQTTQAAEKVLRPMIDRGVVPVVPGFIGRSPRGEVVTLGRGGSDLTATLLGRVLAARDVILWKDVPGLLTADPRVVPDARLIPLLHVREASELAYYGAKVLHPRSLIALQAGTRLIIRPYADPAAHGTEIVVERERKPAAGRARRPVKALTAIADQTLLTIAGNGMVGVPGVAARAFGALERAGVSVSLISQASPVEPGTRRPFTCGAMKARCAAWRAASMAPFSS